MERKRGNKRAGSAAFQMKSSPAKLFGTKQKDKTKITGDKTFKKEKTKTKISGDRNFSIFNFGGRK
tara:strand:- start:998 stop:1195 length:198 start_codon:yes stop_codon:yes gene_type:complete